MTTGITSSDYQMYVQEFLEKNRTKSSINNNSQNLENIQNQSIFSESESGNTCTDGVDDGNISLGAKIKGVGKGILNGAKGMITNVFKHPFKTAAMVGACCIPVVGPAIGVGLATYGLYSGTKTIANGIAVANSATTDAQAKDAWENIGTGALTVAGSAVALKGSAGVLKNQLKTSNTATTFKAARADGKTMAETLQETGEVAVKETAGNLKAVGNQIKEKTYDKAKNTYDKAKVNSGGEKLTADGVKQTASEIGKEFVDKTSEKIGNAGEKIGKKIDEYNKKTEVQSKKVENIKAEADLDGATIKENKNGSFEIEKDGTTIKYNKKGEQILTTKEKIAQAKADAEAKGAAFEETKSGYKISDNDKTTYYNKNGKVLKETELTSKNNVGGMEDIDIKETTYDKKGNIKTETTGRITKDANGEFIDSDLTTKKGNVEIKEYKTDETTTVTSQKGNGFEVKTIEIKDANGKTTTTKEYLYNGKTIENPSIFNKLKAKYNTTNTAVKVDEFISNPITIKGHKIPLTDEQLMGLGVLLNLDA